MTYIAPRTCLEISKHGSRMLQENPPRPLKEWENKVAVVLLGPPGSGKTTVFEREAERQGGIYVTARDFLTFDNQREWYKKTLFIDGLDETRAGTDDGRTPLDSIRAKLDRIGRPHFRLSCREADWFGANDTDHVKKAASDGTVTVVRLDSLSDQDIRNILLLDLNICDPDQFIDLARDKGLKELLANPQSLKLLAVAVESNRYWPETRKQAFDLACRTLLSEHNEEHQVAQPTSGSVADLMEACGKLCAILLLTGASGYSRFNNDALNFLRPNQVPEINRAILRSCLQSKLFETPTPDRTLPVHRHIAEFLAARYLAGLVSIGLPAGRILALITGYDGVVISALRGLSAWLAAHSKQCRTEIIARDPLGTVLYGDASDFSASEKFSVLNGLQREADTNSRFIENLQLNSRLGDLISSDMETLYCEILTDTSREESRQSVILILIEALSYGACLPELANPLMKILRDGTWWFRIRSGAIEPFLRHRDNDTDAAIELKALAADIYSGKVPDPDFGLLGCLLYTLYPAAIPETEIMQYLRFQMRADNVAEYVAFWTQHLPKKLKKDQLIVLLDELAERDGPLFSEDLAHGLTNFPLRQLPSHLLTRYLRLSGDEVDLNRLFLWLGSAAYASGWTDDRSFSSEDQIIRNWIVDRPRAWKTLLVMGPQGVHRQM